MVNCAEMLGQDSVCLWEVGGRAVGGVKYKDANIRQTKHVIRA